MSPASPPVLSVVMPVRNGAAYLEAAVRSVLEQTFRDFEFIIIDDGSTDRTASMLAAFAAADARIRLLQTVGGGIVSALNESRPDLIVVGGYAVFAEQMAIGWAMRNEIPYVLHSESHLSKPRRSVIRAAKRAVLPTVISNAAAGLAVGSKAARYLAAYGLAPGLIRIFPGFTS